MSQKNNIYGFRIIRRGLSCLYFRLLLLIAIPEAALAAGIAMLADRSGRYADIATCVAFLPLRWGEMVRCVFYRLTLEHVGKNVVFKFGSCCQYRKACVGNNVLIGPFTYLGELTLGNDILVGDFVLFLSGNHQHGFADRSKPIAQQPGVRRRITIGSDVWVGSKAVIMTDVGNRCVIAAGAIVTRPVESGTIVGGNPARLLKVIGTLE